MKRKVKKFLSLFFVVVLAFGYITTAFAHSGRTDGSGGHKDNKNKSGLGSYHYHCGGYPAHLHTDGYCPYRDVFPSSVSVSAEKTILGIGEKISVSASVYPANSCDTYVTWSSSDTSIVEISGDTIEAIGYGTATITAKSFNGKKGTINITVKEITADTVSISGVPGYRELFVGEEYQLSASITPSNVDNPTIVWTSSDDAVASVTDNGLIKLLAVGTTKITATASNGIYDSIDLTINEVIAEDLTITGKNTLIIGENTVLNLCFTPANTTDQTVIWSSDNIEIADIQEDGTILCTGVGLVTIRAKHKRVEASFDIEILPINVESIAIETDTVDRVKKGDIINFSALVYPENATYPTITWSTSDSDIATINQDGVLTSLKAGSVKVIATSVDGVNAECEIRINGSITPVMGTIISTGAVGSAIASVVVVAKKKKSKD